MIYTQAINKITTTAYMLKCYKNVTHFFTKTCYYKWKFTWFYKTAYMLKCYKMLHTFYREMLLQIIIHIILQNCIHVKMLQNVAHFLQRDVITNANSHTFTKLHSVKMLQNVTHFFTMRCYYK